MNDLILYVMAGAGVGFAVGLTGVGGGSLMTPLLLMFGFPPPVAIGTDLLYAGLTKAGGALSHHRRGNVDWRVVMLLAVGSLPVAILLHLLLRRSNLHHSDRFADLLTTSLGVMLVITATILFLKDSIRLKANRKEAGAVLRLVQQHQSLSTVVMGAVLGFCVTLSSVGSGAFGAAILLVIYAGTPAVRIIGTDVAHAVPLTLIAGLGYLAAGYVDFLLLLSLLTGSLPAIHLGTHVSSTVPERLLQRMLMLFLFLLGLNYTFH